MGKPVNTKRKLLIKAPKLYNSYWLIPYKITKKSGFVEGFSNIGQSYYWEEPEWLKNCSYTQHFQNKDGLYYCMVLPGYLQRAGIHIKFSENTGAIPFLNLDLHFFGPLLGGRSDDDNLDGWAMWFDIEMILLCDGFSFKYDIPSVGIDRNKFRKQPEYHGKWFTTPLKFRIPVNKFITTTEKPSPSQNFRCKKQDIKEVKLRFTNAYVNDKSDFEKIIKVIWGPKQPKHLGE